MLAILRFYGYLIDNFPIFNSDFLSDVTNILLTCLLQFTIFHQITLFAAYFFYYNAQSLNGKKDAFCLLSFNLRSLILKFVVVI